MPEAVVEKENCSKCGSEVREGTAFCYSCGTKVPAAEPEPKVVADPLAANAQAALDDLARKLDADKADVEKPIKDEKIAKAAAERKKARVTQRKEREFVWEPRSDAPVGLFIAAVAILVAAVLCVLVTVVWK